MIEGPRIYNLFPLLVGSVSKWITHLPRIAKMGFNWVYVNPFHYPGFSGSLYAIKDYYRIHDLMQDNQCSLETLISNFCCQASKYKLSVMMDLVINHTSKDSLLALEHPQWFHHESDGSLYSPRAIDPSDARQVTIWGDLAELNYKNPITRASLISYFGTLISYFIDLGVRGFRCDAAYQVPQEVWGQLIRFARFKHRGVFFFAETLGCKLEQIQALRSSGFDYIFNSVKWWDFKSPWLLEQYNAFRYIAPSIAFPESHDTPRLTSDLMLHQITDLQTVHLAYRLYYFLAATFSSGIMIPIGYEFGFSSKLHVVTTRSENWETPCFDLSRWISTINFLKIVTPPLNSEGFQYCLSSIDKEVVCLIRQTQNKDSWVIVCINTDYVCSHTLSVERFDFDIKNNREITPGRTVCSLHVSDILKLNPGEVRIFVDKRHLSGET